MFGNLLSVVAVACFGYAAAHFSAPIVLKYARSVRFYKNSKIGRATLRSTHERRESKDPDVLKWASREPSAPEYEQLQLYKKLYHEVQNLEEFPDVLPLARNTLICLLSETLCGEQSRPKGSILSLERYSKEVLRKFLQHQDEVVADEWEKYLARRKSGRRRELFDTKDEARDWLARVAPLKLVDGAWLGNIHRVTTPFALRHVTKGAWQVMSEEYGDGNLEQHHVHLYKKLLEEAGARLPEASSADFIQPGHGLDASFLPWKAAVAQLLISLFPHDFLPEILGYNMNFELLTLDTMKAAKELDEVKLDPYYFFLHISIDNSHSGHTAMAMEIVVKYLDHIGKIDGREAMQRAWKRVQAGYCLSSGLGGSPPDSDTMTTMPLLRNEWNHELLTMMQGKAQASGKIHCGSRIKVGGRTLTDWLAPESFASEQRQKDFLRELANWKPWVRKGDSRNSRLMHALSWGGKMFGSFTVAEMDVVRKWIDSLDAGTYDPRAYIAFVEPSAPSVAAKLEEVSVDYPVLAQSRPLDLSGSSTTDLELSVFLEVRPGLSYLISLWFAHVSLLEGFVAIPARTANDTTCAIVRLLRSYYSFASIADGVAGMDEVRKHGDCGLVEIGLRILQRAPDGLSEPPFLLKQVLDRWPNAFALDMLHLSMRPVENCAALLGMAKAFVELHDAVAKSDLVEQADCKALAGIVSVERRLFEKIEVEMERAGATQFQTGYEVARMHVQRCFPS
ncbi:hypothetical protein IWX90DRAFT_257993 [Phyllosticta citrichinensis]|uniref:Uncharacterized protein n=1 Tax=Phyllosticta citrichinensis TaxID=1130410 RepID=A0ABR1XRU6_9PEZI